MASRRSRGDGGLSWDSARQRWVASVTVGYTASGKQIFKRARARTKSEAQRKLKEIIREYEDGLVIGGHEYTVTDAVRDWLAFGLSGRDRVTVTKCTMLVIGRRPACPRPRDAIFVAVLRRLMAACPW
jgi:hypothetical protein